VSLFASRAFSGTNLVTFAMYGALSAALFLLGLQLQQVVGYSPIAAGLSTLPVTILLLVLSPYSGQLARRTGPRLPLTVGPILAGTGLAVLSRIGAGSSYVADILPGVLVFGLGLSFTVAPLTATVMGSVEERHAGVASAINNAVARVAGLIAVAVLPVAAGLTGNAYLDPQVFSIGFRTAILLSGGLAAVAGVVGWLTLGGQTPIRQPEPAKSYASE
jgi:MFS family permease